MKVSAVTTVVIFSLIGVSGVCGTVNAFAGELCYAGNTSVKAYVVASDEEETKAGSDSGHSSSAGTITNDRKKGMVHSVNGILTGITGSTASDGRSHWMLDNRGWRLRYADKTYAAGMLKNGTETPLWEKINGSWYLFSASGYAKFGWYLDAATGNWYYLDINTGMKTGWHKDQQDEYWYYLKLDGTMATGWMQIERKWYYFNNHAPEATWEYNPTERMWNYRTDSNGRPYGSMYRSERTPDDYWVDKNGVWNGNAKK